MTGEDFSPLERNAREQLETGSGTPEGLAWPASHQRKQPAKLEALTSLRFFAAMMIFVYHESHLFNFYDNSFLHGVALSQGVSFFFVLSGFILTYVRPTLQTSAETNDFFLARFARIWPTHFVAFILTVCLLPPVTAIPNAWIVALANLFLVHSWFFIPSVSSSFNNVSWTISIEFFFYLCFPFLVKDLGRPVKLRWSAAAIVSIACIALYIACCATGHLVSSGIYINTNPLARLAEFVLGIALCELFIRYELPPSINRWRATVLEALILLLIVSAVDLGNIWPGPSQLNALWAIHTCALHLGGVPVYGMLIFLMATERGALSKLLTNKLFVRLGEISFSLYMLHGTLLNWFAGFQISFGNVPGVVLPTAAFVACLLASDLNYNFIELPCRRFIRKLGQRQGASTAKDLAAPERQLKKPLPIKLYTAQLLLLLSIIYWVNAQFRFIAPEAAEKIVAHSIPNARDITFDGRFKLCGLKLSRRAEGAYLDLIWQSLIQQRLSCGVIINLIDADRKTLSSKKFEQDTFTRAVGPGKYWEDKITLPNSDLKGALTLGIQIYDPYSGKTLSFREAGSGLTMNQLLFAIP